MRVNDIAKHDRKKAGYERMQRMDMEGVPVPRLMDVGVCNNGKNYYLLEFAARQCRFKLGLFALSILPPGGERSDTAVLCLNPSHSKTLVDFYYGFHEKFEDYCTGIGWYNSIRHRNPIMHSTVGIFDVATIQKAQEIIFASGVFGEAEITALELYTYPMRLIKRFELKPEV